MEAAAHSLLLHNTNYYLQMKAGKGWRVWPRCGGCSPFAPSPVCRLLQAASLSSLRNISLMNHVPCFRSSKRVPSFFAVVLFGTNVQHPITPPPAPPAIPVCHCVRLSTSRYTCALSPTVFPLCRWPQLAFPSLTGEGEGEDGNGKDPM